MADQRPPADLEVPDAARAAFADQHGLPAPGDGFRSAVDWSAVDADVRRIAAPVVAAAFRRVIEEHRYDGEAQNSNFTDGVWHVLGLLEYRADELDGGA